jgi:hypothetical protein
VFAPGDASTKIPLTKPALANAEGYPADLRFIARIWAHSRPNNCSLQRRTTKFIHIRCPERMMSFRSSDTFVLTAFAPDLSGNPPRPLRLTMIALGT